MSLLGRLEDLSLTDIVQIVFLSRRTGMLEIIDASGRHAVVFQQGLIVNASSPKTPDVATFLAQSDAIKPEAHEMVRQTVEAGVPIGTALLDLNLVSPDQLAEAIRDHILQVVGPLMQSRQGEFNFILSEALTAADLEYDPMQVFKEGGIPPAEILGDAEKIKPLAGLEASMKAGKALLRGNTTGESGGGAAGMLDLGFHDDMPPTPSAPDMPLPEIDEALPPEPEFAPIDVPEPFESADAEGMAADVLEVPSEEELLAAASNEAPAPAEESQASGESEPEAPAPVGSHAPPTLHPSAAPHFRVTEETRSTEERRVILQQQDPLLRVSARRAFSRRGMTSSQYGAVADTKSEILDNIRNNRFFVTFLDIGDGVEASYDEANALLNMIKKKNHHLPVVMIDKNPDLKRRHDLLKRGADLYLTKPSEAHLQPGMVEEQLSLFADELVMFAHRAFDEAKAVAGGDETGTYRLAGQERGARSSEILMRLINELNDPNDINQVSQTVLRLASQYLNRGAIFATATVNFVGIGGFGVTGAASEMNEMARSIRIARTEPSILLDVVESHSIHRGKLRKSSGNIKLVEGLGSLMPSEVVVLPILNKEEVVGVLYGDNAENRAPIDDVTGLEIFLSQAGFALRNAMIANRGRYGLE